MISQESVILIIFYPLTYTLESQPLCFSPPTHINTDMTSPTELTGTVCGGHIIIIEVSDAAHTKPIFWLLFIYKQLLSECSQQQSDDNMQGDTLTQRSAI